METFSLGSICNTQRTLRQCENGEAPINYSSTTGHGRFKMVAFLMGMQGGYTKQTCHLCLWDGKADTAHYPTANEPSFRQVNIMSNGNHSKVSQYLKVCSPKLSEVNEGIFVGPQITKIITIDEFTQLLNIRKKQTWNNLIPVHNFLKKKQLGIIEN